SDPVGFGIPVVLSGPWSAPKIYPEIQGILDNPDAAYAKLREMGKGLFGPDGAGLNKLLGGLGSIAGNQSGGGGGDLLGGGLGQALRGLIRALGRAARRPPPPPPPLPPPPPPPP